MRLLVCAALLAACSTTSEPEQGALTAAATCNQSSCDYVAQHKGQTVLTRYLSCCVALMLTACPPNNPPKPPAPDAGGGTAATGGAPATGGAAQTGGTTGYYTTLSKCVLACANLKTLGCTTQQSTCIAQCTLHTSDSRFTQNVDCEIAAKTKADAQKCGPASCH